MPFHTAMLVPTTNSMVPLFVEAHCSWLAVSLCSCVPLLLTTKTIIHPLQCNAQEQCALSGTSLSQIAFNCTMHHCHHISPETFCVSLFLHPTAHLFPSLSDSTAKTHPSLRPSNHNPKCVFHQTSILVYSARGHMSDPSGRCIP